MFSRSPQPPDFNNLNMNVPAISIPGINSAREAQYAKRIKELEEEIRLMKVENDKNVRLPNFCPVWVQLLIACIEADDCEIPGTMGETEGICQAKERSQSGG